MLAYLNRIWSLLYYFLNFFTFRHLDFRAVLFFSVRAQGRKYISIGRNSIVQRGGWLLAIKHSDADPEITIGNNCSVGDYCHITAVGKVVMEDDVLIANNVYISDNLHGYEDIHVPIQNQPVIHKGDVTLGKGCWIGENVCIIGASVGRNSVIGANSVVVKDIGDFCVAVGSPARVIKRYDMERGEWIKMG